MPVPAHQLDQQRRLQECIDSSWEGSACAPVVSLGVVDQLFWFSSRWSTGEAEGHEPAAGPAHLGVAVSNTVALGQRCREK